MSESIVLAEFIACACGRATESGDTRCPRCIAADDLPSAVWIKGAKASRGGSSVLIQACKREPVEEHRDGWGYARYVKVITEESLFVVRRRHDRYVTDSHEAAVRYIEADMRDIVFGEDGSVASAIAHYVRADQARRGR